MSRIGVPGRTSSPSCISACELPFQTCLITDEAGERRVHRHQRRVTLGILQGALGALALDLENPHLCRRRPPLQLERLPQLRQPRGRLLDRQRVLFRLDARHDFVLARLDLARARTFRSASASSVSSFARAIACSDSLFLNLSVEIDQFGAPLGRGADLLLADRTRRCSSPGSTRAPALTSRRDDERGRRLARPGAERARFATGSLRPCRPAGERPVPRSPHRGPSSAGGARRHAATARAGQERGSIDERSVEIERVRDLPYAYRPGRNRHTRISTSRSTDASSEGLVWRESLRSAVARRVKASSRVRADDSSNCRVIGPGVPAPIARSSMATTGVTSRVVPVMNASSAV